MAKMQFRIRKSNLKSRVNYRVLFYANYIPIMKLFESYGFKHEICVYLKFKTFLCKYCIGKELELKLKIRVLNKRTS